MNTGISYCLNWSHYVFQKIVYTFDSLQGGFYAPYAPYPSSVKIVGILYQTTCIPVVLTLFYQLGAHLQDFLQQHRSKNISTRSARRFSYHFPALGPSFKNPGSAPALFKRRFYIFPYIY